MLVPARRERLHPSGGHRMLRCSRVHATVTRDHAATSPERPAGAALKARIPRSHSPCRPSGVAGSCLNTRSAPYPARLPVPESQTMTLTQLRAEWAPNITRDVLAGTVVALALIPEAIAFSIIAGVDPKLGLYASFCDRHRHRHHRRPPGDDLRRHRRDGAGHGHAGARPRRRIPLRRHGADRRVPDHRRLAAPGRPHALRLALGRHRLRQRARHPDLHGAIAGTRRPRLAGLRDGRGRASPSSTACRG